MNRVYQKPYVELPQLQDLALEDAARRCWHAFQQRDDSLVVDYFQGQYRSHLTCPECQTESTTFDPFRCLSLPLPAPRAIFVVHVLRNDQALPVDHDVHRLSIDFPRRELHAFSLRPQPNDSSDVLVQALANRLKIGMEQIELALCMEDEVRRILHEAWPWTLDDDDDDDENVPGGHPVRLQSLARELKSAQLLATVLPAANAAVADSICCVRVTLRCLPLREVTKCDHCQREGVETAGGSRPPAKVPGGATVSDEQDLSPLKRCARCRQVAYCGLDCQKAAFSSHQSTCKKAFAAATVIGQPLRVLCARRGMSLASLKKRLMTAAGLEASDAVLRQYTMVELLDGGLAVAAKAVHLTAAADGSGLVLPATLDVGLCWWQALPAVADKQASQDPVPELQGPPGIDDVEWHTDDASRDLVRAS